MKRSGSFPETQACFNFAFISVECLPFACISVFLWMQCKSDVNVKFTTSPWSVLVPVLCCKGLSMHIQVQGSLLFVCLHFSWVIHVCQLWGVWWQFIQPLLCALILIVCLSSTSLCPGVIFALVCMCFEQCTVVLTLIAFEYAQDISVFDNDLKSGTQ